MQRATHSAAAAAVSVTICAAALITGCMPSLSRREVASYKSRTLYTCCNIHFESWDVSDANYHVGHVLALGTPVQVESVGHRNVWIKAGSGELRLSQDYGRDQESFRQYLDKILVADDPTVRLASFPPDVQRAIRESRVERGMTREQVIMSLGYPPTHRTPSTAAREWTYWYGRSDSYEILFGRDGTVAQAIGSVVPTEHQPIKR